VASRAASSDALLKLRSQAQMPPFYSARGHHRSRAEKGCLVFGLSNFGGKGGT
jgi:hypothetical protein